MSTSRPGRCTVSAAVLGQQAYRDAEVREHLRRDTTPSGVRRLHHRAGCRRCGTARATPREGSTWIAARLSTPRRVRFTSRTTGARPAGAARRGRRPLGLASAGCGRSANAPTCSVARICGRTRRSPAHPLGCATNTRRSSRSARAGGRATRRRADADGDLEHAVVVPQREHVRPPRKVFGTCLIALDRPSHCSASRRQRTVREQPTTRAR